MFTTIYKLRIGIPGVEKIAEYGVPPKQALVDYLMQLKGNYNTWEYPEVLDGMREGSCGGWLWQDDKVCYGAYQKGE